MILSLVFAPLLFIVYMQTRLYNLHVVPEATVVATPSVSASPTALIVTAYHTLSTPYSITNYERNEVVPYTAPSKAEFGASTHDLVLILLTSLILYLLCLCMVEDNRYTSALAWRSMMIEKLEPLKESLDRVNDVAAAESLMELSRSTVEQLTPLSSVPPSPTLRRSLRHQSQVETT